MLDHVERFVWKSKCSYNMYLATFDQPRGR